MAEPLGLMLKTYRDDLPYAVRLIESFRRYNTEGLPMFVVAAADELAELAGLAGPDVILIDQALLGGHFSDHRVHGNSVGYVNQEIVKLSFWELGLLANYVCVDSELVFVRAFGRRDFMVDEETPYTFLSEDAELRVEPDYHSMYWQRRAEMLGELSSLLELEEPRLLTIHGMAVLSSTVLGSLKEDFLDPRAWSYVDALEFCPYEFSWYNFWLQKTHVIPLVMREPVFKTIHSASQHLEYGLKGVTTTDIARGYVGVVVNSGYSREFGLVSFDEPRYQLMGRYLGYRSLIRAWVARVTRKAPRVQRLLRISR